MTAVIRAQAFLAVTNMGSNCIDNLNYIEKDKVQSTTDSVILWEASCGYYATAVQSLVDLASGFEDSVQKEPEADQTVTGDFKLIFDGLSFASSIAPNELSIKSKANGGLDITADTNGLTTVKAKGVPVQSYDENGVQMLESLKMPLSYASTDVNDVVVKAELTEVDQKVESIPETYFASFLVSNNVSIVGQLDIIALPLDSVFKDDDCFSHINGSNEITVLKEGVLRVSGLMSYFSNVAGDNCRAVGRNVFDVNGEADDAGLTVGGYIRGIDSDESSTASSTGVSFYRQVSAGDVISWRGGINKVDSASTNQNFTICGEVSLGIPVALSRLFMELTEL